MVMNFQDHFHFKHHGVDFFQIAQGGHTEGNFEYYKNVRLFLHIINQILNHQGEQKDHIITLMDACSNKCDDGHTIDTRSLDTYYELFDWIENKSGKPIGNHSVLLFENAGESLISSHDYLFLKLILEKYPEITIILSSSSSHGITTSRSVKKLFGNYKNFYHVCDNSWYPEHKDWTEEYPEYLKTYPKEKTFVYFGGCLRWHRKLLLFELFHNNLMDHGFVSYQTPESYVPEILLGCPDAEIMTYDPKLHDLWHERDINNKLPTHKSLYEGVDVKGTIVADDGGMNVSTEIQEIDYQFYLNSYVTLLPETTWWSSNSEYFRKCFVDYEHGDYSAPANFFSEKTYRAIVNCMPFVMLNTPHSLDALRRMGFKTYHPYIDETYDTIEDDQDRLTSLIQTLIKLKDNPPDMDTMIKMYEIALYNRVHLTRITRPVIITDNQGVKI